VTPWRRNRMPVNDTADVTHTRELIRMTMDEIGRADAKAGVLFTGAGVILGAAATVLVANAARFSSLPPRLDIPLLLSAACAIAALATLGMASYPRGVRGRKAVDGRVTYFGEVVRITDDTQLREALESAQESVAEALARQLRQLSVIVYRKYFYIRVAYLFFAVMLMAIFASAIEVLSS
jgi:hypothetical protein